MSRMNTDMSEDLKSSAHVWGGDQGDNHDSFPTDEPPAYSGATPEVTQEERPSLPARPRRKPIAREPYNPVQAIVKWSRIPWGRYVVPDAVVSADRITITTTHNTFVTNQQALVKLLTDQSTLPPMPTIRIEGSHDDSTTRAHKVDFDLYLNLSPLLDLSRTPRWYNKPAQVVPIPDPNGRAQAASTVVGNNAVQIEAAARQFLKDRSDRKSLVLTRTVENLHSDVIEGLVRNLIASLKYRGKVNVTFPIQSSQLVVQKKPATTGAAVGGWFMNVLGLSPDVKYESLERVWEVGYSSNAAADGGDDAGESSSNDQAESNVLIKQWWNAWSPAIRDSILLKRQGKVGIEDWMEAQMGWRPKPMTQDWGVGFEC